MKHHFSASASQNQLKMTIERTSRQYKNLTHRLQKLTLEIGRTIDEIYQ